MPFDNKPSTPAGVKEEWERIRPDAVWLQSNFKKDGYFTRLLEIMDEWIDAELGKAVPQSPEVAIDVVLSPLRKRKYFGDLIASASDVQEKKLRRLKSRLGALKIKCRKTKW